MSGERKVIGPADLKKGQVKVVVYSYKGCTIIVPDSEWSMKGDLLQLPSTVQRVLAAPRKNHLRKYQRVIGPGTHSTLVPSGKKVLDEIASKGYFKSNRGVSFSELQ